MNFAKTLLILVIFWQFCDAAEVTKELKKQVNELETKYKSIQLSMDGLNSAMNYIYPDMDFVRSIDANLIHSIYPDMDLVQSIDVNLRHSNKGKYKKYKRKVNKIQKEWSGDSTTSVSGMCAIISDYYEGICQQNDATKAKCQTIPKVLCGCEFPEFANDQYCDDGNNNVFCNWDGGACCNNDPFSEWDKFCTDCECLEPADQSFPNVNGRATSDQIEDLEDLVSNLLTEMTSFETIFASMIEFLMEMNTPTPPGDLLLVAVGSDKWTEAHDMNKALNRICALQVLPDYPLSSDNSGLMYPAGGLVSGRPFFCGGKGRTHQLAGVRKETIRTECYTLGQPALGSVDDITWDLVANLKIARWYHAGVSFGDSLWVTGGRLEDGTVTKTTEIIHSNGTVEDGPDLPKARDAHCMVLLPPGTKVMILGADNSFGSRKTVTIFDRITETFSSGVKMNFNREKAACTIFKSPNHGNRPVVFVGGGKDQITAEILDYSQSDATWEIVPSMSSLYPSITNMGGARAVPTPNMDGVIFIFGTNFWELTFKNSQWVMIQMTQSSELQWPNLAVARKAWPIVEYIDEDLFDVTGLCT